MIPRGTVPPVNDESDGAPGDAADTDGIDTDAARRALQDEKSRVAGLIGNIKDELDDEQGELADYDQHPADTATDTFEREKDLSILEQLEAELAEVEAALSRIDDGTYGLDERTGEPIDPARLEALPTARTNIDTP